MSVYALAILPNSNIVSGSYDKTIKIWQSEYPYQLITTLYGHTSEVYKLIILPNSNIVCTSDDNTIKIWQTKGILQNETNISNSIQSIYKSDNQNSEITALTFFNYIYLFVGFSDSIIKYWNILDFSQSLLNSYHNQAIKCIFNLNDQFLLSGSLDRKIVV
jgi:WD40 repeat protein